MGLTYMEIKTEIWISFIACCHNKNIHLWLFFLDKVYNFLNDPQKRKIHHISEIQMEMGVGRQ